MTISNTKPLCAAIFFLALTFSFGADAGWNSSGGDDFNNHHNPWFVRNTPVVSYCVAVDSDTMSTKSNKIESLVEKALSYWNEQFRKGGEGGQAIRLLGTHDFVKKANCDGSEDIKFQFGFGTLSREQSDYLGSQNRYIGIAVRTDYDPIQLRGKGFVYFASDVGPNKIRTDGFVATPWSYDGLLYRAIAHEVGHVFGVPHIGDGLMAETYLERILNKSIFELYTNADNLVDFFTPPLESSSCKISEKVSGFLNLPKGAKCIHLTHLHNNMQYHLATLASADEQGKKIAAGKIIALNKCIPSTGARPDMKMKLDVTVRFDEKQVVYSKKEIGAFESFVSGPATVEIGCPATYETTDGKKIAVYYRFGPGFHEILGFVGGSVQQVYSAKINFMFGN